MEIRVHLQTKRGREVAYTYSVCADGATQGEEKRDHKYTN